MSARLRSWLTVLLAGAFALAMVATPSEHARAVLGKAAVEVHHALPEHHSSGHHGGDTDGSAEHHVAGPACLACVVMAAPGLPAMAAVGLARIAAAETGAHAVAQAVAARPIARAPQRARAPPAVGIT